MSERERVFSKQFLPAEDDPRWQQWQKKRLVVRMMPLTGPVTIITVDAPTKLPPEWEGWLAIDMAGHPYPLHRDVQAAAYEPVQPAVADEREQPKGDWVLWVCGRDHHIGIEKGTPPWEMGLCPLCDAIDALAAAREMEERLRSVVLGIRPGPGAGLFVSVGDLIDAEKERNVARAEVERLRELLKFLSPGEDDTSGTPEGDYFWNVTHLQAEVRRLKQVLIDTDDTLCEIASGNQGSFKPHHGTVSMADLAIDRLRVALPLKDRDALAREDGGVPQQQP